MLFFITAITVQVALFIKFPLFIVRQISPRVFLIQSCPEVNVSNAGREYIFTMVVYGALYIGRCAEAVILHIHVYKFFFCEETTIPLIRLKQLLREVFKNNKRELVLLCALTLIITMHSLSIPALGIVLEMKHGRETNCADYVYEYHTVYWTLDFIRYLHDVVIRILMILATVIIGEIWSQKSDHDFQKDDTCETEPKQYVDYLTDREVTSEDHKNRTEDYIEKGSEVERIEEIFETWFIIPWVLYFISSSLDTENILKSWQNGSNNVAQYDFSEIAFLVYNFNQISLLAVSYFSSKRMNTHHHRYFTQSRDQQLTKYKTSSRMALACMNKIEKDQHFDFVPRIWGSSIKIPVQSPLYVVMLFVGLFFTVIDAMI